MNLSKKSFKQVMILIRKFERAGTVESIFFLKEAVILMKINSDERFNNYLNKIQEELNFNILENRLEEIPLQKDIIPTFDRYENMFGQMVLLHIS